MTPRKKYTKEFKLDAVSLVTDQGYSRAEAARSLGINANMLCRWVQEEQSGDGQACRSHGQHWVKIVRIYSRLILILRCAFLKSAMQNVRSNGRRNFHEMGNN